MDSDSEEENPDWNRFWSCNPSADNPHEFGMEKGTGGEMDCRKKVAEWEKLGETLGDRPPEDVVL